MAVGRLRGADVLNRVLLRPCHAEYSSNWLQIRLNEVFIGDHGGCMFSSDIATQNISSVRAILRVKEKSARPVIRHQKRPHF